MWLQGQVAETVCEATLAPGEPTRNFIVGLVTHPLTKATKPSAADGSRAGGHGLDQRRSVCGWRLHLGAKPGGSPGPRPELIGPAQPALQKDGRLVRPIFKSIGGTHRGCPAGKTNTNVVAWRRRPAAKSAIV